MQTSKSGSLLSLATAYGGVGSLFRGMAAPVSSACVINAIIFSSYGWSSRMYDQHVETPDYLKSPIHDSTLKALICGSFAGIVQTLVVCPMEHVKCRLQIQHGKGSPDNLYKGPLQATRSILKSHGLSGLFRGWCVTSCREVPAFGVYFAFYDFAKDKINSMLAKQAGVDENEAATGNAVHSHTWAASALAGGSTGALTWAFVYPFDIIKTRIQTTPMDTPLAQRRILTIGREIIQREGWRTLFRGLNVTVIRAFPVNGIIFPVYEYTLMNVAALEY
jgi:solute carrier family 25 carnitine/acylcarnitine transporter 20/29